MHLNLFKTLLVTVLALFTMSISTAQTWEIGYKSMTFTDPSRGNRQIPFHMCYPADVQGWDVPFGSPSDKRYPIVVFGHDEATGFQHYSYICNYLTVRGFIVIYPLTEMGAVMDVEEFAKDMAFIASTIKAQRYDPTSIFYQRHNSKSSLIGHGKGASAAVLGVQHFPTVTTLVTLAANEVAPGVAAAASSITTPAVVVAGGQDCVSPLATVQEAIFNNLQSDCKTLINYTTVPRCPFAQNASNCTAIEVTCGGANPYSWQAVSNHTAYLLVSFMRYYMKSNAPALNKFEWKLQQKLTDFQYIMACNNNVPRQGWQPEDSEGELEEQFISDIKLFPNPISTGNDGRLQVETLTDMRVSIRVINLMGQEMLFMDKYLTEGLNELEIPTDNLAKGHYLVTVNDGFQRSTKPLVIN
jgi:hypothetical protein